ncbi:ABC-2 family transporter protein [Mitsuaria sp. WAJ17]|uniref:ABC transporter permease n=1 Tax=Mitsuaria sp. WAJ17 TaxID=2761452 RepID=UPI00160241C4|nr:ABC-2 family transporter protein [Mitsuaria sp. WAJ17]MBB2485172.1 ABC-2 family transporter protein [Mitsuaria sp. WAJ17]
MMLTLARIRFAEVIAWRAEFLLWLMTLTMPLIMLVFWRAVTRDGAFAGYTSQDITAYFLAVLAVALLTECNLVWNLNEDLRTGGLSFWLIKPAHPLSTYLSITLAELPARVLVALPVIGLALHAGGAAEPVGGRLLLFLLSLPMALGINQAVQIMVGSLGFWMDRSITLFKLYEHVGSLLSGYMIPLAFLPAGVRGVADWLPYRFVISLPVELLLGQHDGTTALRLLLVQAAMLVVLNLMAMKVWALGVRRYTAFG